jgi:saccharopine dehydrogenase-like NADP-dependent oxidoreductase
MHAIREFSLLSLQPIRVDGCDIVPRDFFIQVVSPRLRITDGRDLRARPRYC